MTHVRKGEDFTFYMMFPSYFHLFYYTLAFQYNCDESLKAGGGREYEA